VYLMLLRHSAPTGFALPNRTIGGTAPMMQQ
jgi:hypothetical protein